MEQDPRHQLVTLLPRLRRFAVALTGDRTEADDLVQAACVRALSNLDKWQANTRLDSWLYKVAQNLWIDDVRKRRSRGETVEIDELGTVAGQDGREHMSSRLMLDAARRAIGMLNEDQRSVLVLVTVEGLSYQETADVLEIPIGSVMSRLARARRRVHELVHGEGQSSDVLPLRKTTA